MAALIATGSGLNGLIRLSRGNGAPLRDIVTFDAENLGDQYQPRHLRLAFFRPLDRSPLTKLSGSNILDKMHK